MGEEQEQKFHQLTEEPVSRVISHLAVPCIISMLVTAFYNMADTFFVGMLRSNAATGAVGVVFSMMAVIQAVGFFFGHGSGNFISRELGRRNTDSASNMAATGFFSALFTGLLICVFGEIFLTPLAAFLGSSPTILPYAKDYLRVILIGAPWMTASLVLNNQLRFQGNAIYGTIGIASGAVLNIGLDPLLIFVFDLGVAGAAWATILSQGVSALLCLVYMLKKFPILRTGRADWAWHGPMVRRLARMGIPTALSNSVTAIGCMILQVTINGFGSTVVAAYTAASKVEQLTTQPTFTFGLAAATFTAQNAGAGKLDRVKDGVRKATVLNLIAGLAAAVVVWLFAAPITTWFVDPGETAVIAASVQFLNIEAVFILALGVLFVYRNALQGLGNAVMPLISGGVELAMRLAAAILLSRFLGYVGVCLANPVAWTGAAVMLVPAYLAELRRQQNNALARAR
mgnify:CR=1 FL=1